MADPKSGEEPRSEASLDNGKLPTAEAPPLSPASEQPQPAVETQAAAPAAAEAAAPPPRLQLKPQYKRQALLAATVALAAGFGAVIGALAWSSPPPRDVAGLQERAAMQQSIAHLSKQMALLRTNLEKANKTAHVQIASVSGRLDAAHAEIAGISKRLDAAPAPAPAPARAAAVAPAPDPDITGSIPPAPQAADVPMPRPAPRIAAVESRPTVVPGWRIRGARRGFVYVQNRGDIFQVVPGARLPGLGAVTAIRHQDGRWVVVTPRGIIVSQRDRRYFD
jgi:hypothetical protein